MSNPFGVKAGRPVNEAGFQPPAAAPPAANWGGSEMLKLETAGKNSKEVRDAFSASLFFSILREGGCNPVVRSDGVYVCFNKYSAIVKDARAWAVLHDPEGDARMEYADAAWNCRPPGVEVVELG